MKLKTAFTPLVFSMLLFSCNCLEKKVVTKIQAVEHKDMDFGSSENFSTPVIYAHISGSDQMIIFYVFSTNNDVSFSSGSKVEFTYSENDFFGHYSVMTHSTDKDGNDVATMETLPVYKVHQYKVFK